MKKVVALFDYTSDASDHLSFSVGDVIEVLHKEPSGWWDGICKDKRGWFPSTYVSKISPKGHVPSIITDLSEPESQISNKEVKTTGTLADSGYNSSDYKRNSRFVMNNLDKILTTMSKEPPLSAMTPSSAPNRKTPIMKFGSSQSSPSYSVQSSPTQIDAIRYIKDLIRAIEKNERDKVTHLTESIIQCTKSLLQSVESNLDDSELDPSSAKLLDDLQMQVSNLLSKVVVRTKIECTALSTSDSRTKIITNLQDLIFVMDQIQDLIPSLRVDSPKFINGHDSLTLLKAKNDMHLIHLDQHIDTLARLLNKANVSEFSTHLFSIDFLSETLSVEMNSIVAFLDRLPIDSVPASCVNEMKTKKMECEETAANLILDCLSSTSPNKDILLNRIQKVENSLSRLRKFLLPYTQQEFTSNGTSNIEYSGYSSMNSLGYDYLHELIKDSTGKIKAGTMRALIEQLTLHDAIDPEWTCIFLDTFKIFTTPADLFRMLMDRFNIEPPNDLPQGSLQTWKEKKQFNIQLQVFNVFKIWIEQYLNLDSSDDRMVFDAIIHFAVTTFTETLPHVSEQFIKIIERKKMNAIPIFIQSQGKIPSPILPRNMSRLKFLELDALELARQWTLLQFKEFKKIKHEDFLWKLRGLKYEPESLREFSNTCQLLTVGVAKTLLSEKDLAKRVAILKHFILIAEKCITLNNFCTAKCILGALQLEPISRLKMTWSTLPGKIQKQFNSLCSLVSSDQHYSKYRYLVKDSKGPLLSIIHLHIADMEWLHAHSPTFVDSGMVNVKKLAHLSSCISSHILQPQKLEFQLHCVQELELYLKTCFSESIGMDKLKSMSMELESAKSFKKTDDAVARALKVSGFL